MNNWEAIVEEMVDLSDYLNQIDGSIDATMIADILALLLKGHKTKDVVSDFGLDEMRLQST